jgi:hypothetical protein
LPLHAEARPPRADRGRIWQLSRPSWRARWLLS